MRAAPRGKRLPTAMLLPLSGPSAALGRSMQRAATLVISSDPREPEPVAYDTLGTPAGAQAAAALAVRRGARLLLGPLFTAEVRPALVGAAGRAPLIAFSNDESLVESGAFLLGITARQLAGTVLGYARQRGVKSVVVLAGADPWGRQAAHAARDLGTTLGLDLALVDGGALAGPALLAAIRTAGRGGDLPDAVFVPDGGGRLIEVARVLAGSDVQLLGTLQGLDPAPATLAAIQGAWLSAPDPTAFNQFAQKYEQRHGGQPGAITVLGQDAATIAEVLRKAGRMDRAALLALRDYPCVTGPLSFRSDGSCVRRLGVLVATPEGYLPTPATPAAA